jgi:hypothetical protein
VRETWGTRAIGVRFHGCSRLLRLGASQARPHWNDRKLPSSLPPHQSSSRFGLVLTTHNRRTDKASMFLIGMVVYTHVGAGQLALEEKTTPGKIGA